jgi:hypothetical protein
MRAVLSSLPVMIVPPIFTALLRIIEIRQPISVKTTVVAVHGGRGIRSHSQW